MANATLIREKVLTPKSPKSLLGRKFAALGFAWLALAIALRGRSTLQLDRSSLTSVHTWLSSLSDTIDRNRTSNPFFLNVVNKIRSSINTFVNLLQDAISQGSATRSVPQIGWLGVVAIIGLAVLVFASSRTALLAVVGFVTLGLLGLWQESMDTLALTLAAVLLSLLIGIPLGVLAGLFPKFERLLTPILDFAQVMPTFVYLTPVTLFFLIGPASATIVTLIYSIPPALRITAVAIREVPWSTVEASISMGSTRWQALRKVQLPQAKRTIVVGINQTIMAALSMVTIAALIDAPGLGRVVLKALETLDVGRSFQAGLGIVIMAVVLDRSTTAAAARVQIASDPKNAKTRRMTRGAKWLAVTVALIAIYVSNVYVWASQFPGAGVLGTKVAAFADSTTGWIQFHLVSVTNGLTDIVSYGLINPIQSLLVNAPWYVTGAAVVIAGYLLKGFHLAGIVVVCIVTLLVSGLWSDSMVTLAATLVAALITIVLGIAVGTWVGRSRRVDRILRPILDAGQVMPAFVYLVPFLGLFGATRFTAIMAAVVYAAPVSIKLVADGIRGVPETITEAAISAGSNTWQLITKVQLPTARRAIALAINQGLIYVLAMVVVGGLVGAGGLGYLVVAGFVQENLKGKGLAAGVAIVVLGILIDRLTQAVADRRDVHAKAAGS